MLKFLAAAMILGSATIASAEEAWLSIPAPPAMPAASSSGMAQVNGISMYYATYGDAGGTPVLLIHGGLGHADLWANQVADLSRDHRVIVADTRGHGRSTNDGSDYSIELLAKDYLALLDSLDIDRVDLVGWSDGANIGYEVAKTAPGRLSSLFAHAGNVTLAGVDPSVESDAVFGSYIGMMATDYARLSPTPDGFEAFVGAISKMWFADKPDGLELLKSVTVPTLVVQGEHDEAILAEHSAAIAAAIPGAKLLTLKGVSHFAMLQDPAGYTAAIRAWVDRP
ncbi:alpha/beta fold hydrolase [Chthonobacter albigriseus]|uniref:alpha/beta fold hydrolase n=1 Tax=Chthonobacter albigriseus TaxID=1683161 RepID=UPI0015EEACC1|nr:alpha/beta fold hydrolase [Chthonobacter albigriseus]